MGHEDTVVLVCVALINAYTAWLAQRARVASEQNHTKLDEIHLQINSRMSELLDLTRKSATAEGRVIEKQEQVDTTKAEKST